MSGYDTYLSFVNYVKDQLTGSGIAVDVEKKPDMSYPYLIIQDGPQNIRSNWVSSRLCQAWLCVQKKNTEPIATTMGRALDKVLLITRDAGAIAKYDWSVSPKAVSGTFFPKIFEITGKMPGNDPNIEKRVITWELLSNDAS